MEKVRVHAVKDKIASFEEGTLKSPSLVRSAIAEICRILDLERTDPERAKSLNLIKDTLRAGP